jgi:hypothetical protein
LPDRFIQSLGDFLEANYALEVKWREHQDVLPVWYRGHGRAEWSLDPTLLRPPYLGFSKTLYSKFLHEFRFLARAHVSDVPRNLFEWLVLARHHGVPSRLLDWTDVAATALYFAVRPPHDSHDGAVWFLSPKWLFRKTKPAELGVPVADSDLVIKLSAFPLDDTVGAPVPVYPDLTVARMVNQRSRFTLHRWQPGGIESAAQQEGASALLQRLVIPKEAKPRIRHELRLMGVTEATIFPDLDGLARDIRLDSMNDISGF